LKYLASILLIISFCVQGQNFKAVVQDAETQEALPFVNIGFNNQGTLGTSTDIDGYFTVPESVDLQSLTFSYLGYERLTITVDEINKSIFPYIISLQPSAFNLDEIVVVPGENPADIIMKKVVENRSLNDPAELEAYKLRTYNKTTYDFLPNEQLKELGMGETSDSIVYDEDEKTNKLIKRAIEMSERRHLFMLESVTEKKFKKPDKVVETVIANKVSGFKEPSFAPVPANFQPFSFYTDYIRILDDEYINPISKGSTKKYFFNIEDTLITESLDSVYILSFQPKRGRNFNALKGIIYVNTDGYALQSIMAEPSQRGSIYARLQQQCNKIENQWFPHQINFEIVFENVPNKNVGMKIVGKTYIKDVVLNPPISDKDFGIEQLTISDQANEAPDSFWVAERIDTLSLREQTTYQEMEKLGKKLKLDYWMEAASKLAEGYLPVYFVDVDLDKIIRSNQVEGFRLGFGARTNEKISELFEVGGYFGYGFKDKQWKYGGYGKVNINRENEVALSAGYKKDLTIAAQSQLEFPANILDVRDYIVANLDAIREYRAGLDFRMFKYAKVKTHFSVAKQSPHYNYNYYPSRQDTLTGIDPDLILTDDFDFTEIGIHIRYAHKEKIIQSLGRRVGRGTKYPVFYAAYSHGFKGFLGGEYEYNRFELGMTQTIKTKSIGKSYIRLEGGAVFGNVPYSKLFLSKGNFSYSVPVFVYYTFQTMRIFEFLNDRYVHLFWVHDLGHLLINRKKFKPDVKLVQGIGYGRLRNGIAGFPIHSLEKITIDEEENIKLDTGFETMEKGYFESGILVNNLVRFNIMNIAYIGLGAGVFYRYGPYSNDKQINNFAFKASFYFSTN